MHLKYCWLAGPLLRAVIERVYVCERHSGFIAMAVGMLARNRGIYFCGSENCMTGGDGGPYICFGRGISETRALTTIISHSWYFTLEASFGAET